MVFQDSAPCLQWPDRSGFAPDSLSSDSHRHLLQQYVIHVIIIASLLSFCQDSFLFIIFLQYLSFSYLYKLFCRIFKRYLSIVILPKQQIIVNSFSILFLTFIKYKVILKNDIKYYIIYKKVRLWLILVNLTYTLREELIKI